MVDMIGILGVWWCSTWICGVRSIDCTLSGVGFDCGVKDSGLGMGLNLRLG